MLALNKQIVLGSASPRRQELLKIFHLPFEVRTQNSDESFPATLSAEEIPVFIAEQKRNALFSSLKNNELLLTVDTVVVLNNEIIGKAENFDAAFEMISKLSGKKHEVISGVCLTTRESSFSFFEKTTVYFKNLTPEEIRFYINEYRPYDKAGAYGIQEWLGMIGISGIEGCFYNVMGLPVSRLYSELTARNF